MAKLMFNNYPLSYLKAFIRKSKSWAPQFQTRQHRLLLLRSLTVFKHTQASAAFRQAWGLPPA
jgi:hypothetical protein